MPMKMPMKRIAVAGYGFIGQVHLSALKSLGLEACLLVGKDKGKTRLFADSNGIPNWTVDYGDLLKHRIEVLHVCTPPAQHFDLVRFALENDIHVICEKPLTLDEKEAELLATLSEKQNLVNAVCFNVRYHGSCMSMRDLVGNGRIGDVLLVNGSYMQQFHALPCEYSWRYEARSLATTEIGSHWIDLLTFVTKMRPEAVSATFGSFQPDRTIKNNIQYAQGSVDGKAFHLEADNAAIVTFRLEGNALASLVLSEITQGRNNYLEMSVTGTDGSLWWNSDDLGRVHVGYKGENSHDLYQTRASSFETSIAELLRDVYRDIEKGVPSSNPDYATFRNGLYNARVCNAIYQSAHNGSKWVEIQGD